MTSDCWSNYCNSTILSYTATVVVTAVLCDGGGYCGSGRYPTSIDVHMTTAIVTVTATTLSLKWGGGFMQRFD